MSQRDHPGERPKGDGWLSIPLSKFNPKYDELKGKWVRVDSTTSGTATKHENPSGSPHSEETKVEGVPQEDKGKGREV